MKFTGEAKLLLGILACTILIVAIAAVVLTKPPPIFSKEDMLPQSAHIKGNPQAKVFLVEFSDFQCPACLAAKPFVDDLLNTYKENIVFSYRHFPLDQHPFGQKAAIMAEAAAEQGKFWEMYDVLFANQQSFSEEFFTSLTTSSQFSQFDGPRLASDSANPALKARVLNDQAAGVSFGVNSTPSFFLNGTKLELTSFADLKTAVEQALK